MALMPDKSKFQKTSSLNKSLRFFIFLLILNGEANFLAHALQKKQTHVFRLCLLLQFRPVLASSYIQKVPPTIKAKASARVSRVFITLIHTCFRSRYKQLQSSAIKLQPQPIFLFIFF